MIFTRDFVRFSKTLSFENCSSFICEVKKKPLLDVNLKDVFIRGPLRKVGQHEQINIFNKNKDFLQGAQVAPPNLPLAVACIGTGIAQPGGVGKLDSREWIKLDSRKWIKLDHFFQKVK